MQHSHIPPSKILTVTAYQYPPDAGLPSSCIRGGLSLSGFTGPVSFFEDYSMIPNRYFVFKIRRTLSSMRLSVMVPSSTAAFRPS